MKVTREFVMTDDARRHWRYFDVFTRRIILDELDVQLVENDPEDETYHKGKLKTPVGEATHKVDIQTWRALYKVERTSGLVRSVVAIVGEKRGNKLFVEGEEFQT